MEGRKGWLASAPWLRSGSSLWSAWGHAGLARSFVVRPPTWAIFLLPGVGANVQHGTSGGTGKVAFRAWRSDLLVSLADEWFVCKVFSG